MLKITIQVVGKENTIRRLKQAGVELENFSQELRDSGKYLVDFFKLDVFDTQGSILGFPWKPLSPKYEFQKRVQYPGRGILIRTGSMQGDFRFTSSKNFLRVYNTAPYFKYHQIGGPIIPKRTMMAIDDTRAREIIKILKDGLLQRIRKALG